MVLARSKRGAGAKRPRPIVDSKAEAVAELMLEVAQCFFKIRAVGQKAGLISSAFRMDAVSYAAVLSTSFSSCSMVWSRRSATVST